MAETTKTPIFQPAHAPTHQRPQPPSSSCLDTFRAQVDGTLASESNGIVEEGENDPYVNFFQSSHPSLPSTSPGPAHLLSIRRLWNAVSRLRPSANESSPGESPKRTGFFTRRLHSNAHSANKCDRDPEVVEVAAVRGFQRYVAAAKPVRKTRPLATTNVTLIPTGHAQTDYAHSSFEWHFCRPTPEMRRNGDPSSDAAPNSEKSMVSQNRKRTSDYLHLPRSPPPSRRSSFSKRHASFHSPREVPLRDDGQLFRHLHRQVRYSHPQCYVRGRRRLRPVTLQHSPPLLSSLDIQIILRVSRMRLSILPILVEGAGIESPSNVNANIHFGHALAKANVNGNDGSEMTPL
ncbi:hypothetical protein P692DRAFT_20881464 [Suillus brevipes Sb2]|nr:hypothetical protein P692DRAFT_20881464 [Suillus brevipes Sb2]